MSPLKKRFTIARLLLALILIVGCEKDSLPIEEAEMLTLDEKIEKQFTMDAFEDPSGTIKDNLEINWQNFSEKEIDSTLWREYDAKEIIPFSVSSKLITATRYKVLVTIVDDNTFVYLIAKLASFDSAENYSYFKLNKYSGMVYIMGMDGKTQLMQTYKKGEMIGNVLDIDNVSIKNLPVSARTCMERGTAYARTYDCPDSLSCAYQVGSLDTGGCGGSIGGTGGYITVRTEFWTDYYLDRGSYMEYSGNSVYNGSSTEYIWVESSNHSIYYQYSYAGLGQYTDGYGGGGIAPFNVNTTPTAPGPSEIVRMIFDTSIKQSSRCMYFIIEELRKKDNHHSVAPDIFNNTGTSHLSQIILDLFNTKSNYYLRWKVGEAGTDQNGNPRNAFTDPIQNFPSQGSLTFEITIDDEYLQNGSRLALARTAIHESIHAYLGYLYTNSTTNNSYFSNLLKHHITASGLSWNDAHHRVMHEFTQAVGRSLAAWDNHRLPQSYYDALGWSGDLMNSPEFAALSIQQQTYIKNVNKAEGNAIISASSSSQSTKCN